MPTHRDLPLTPQERARPQLPPQGRTTTTGARSSRPLPQPRAVSRSRRPRVRRNHDDEIVKAAIFLAAVAVFAHAIGA